MGTFGRLMDLCCTSKIAAAICSYLQRFCTVEVTDAAQKLRRITFQGEVLLDGHFWEADGFVLHIENRRPVLIRTI